ncbi:unnamed protein product [Parajaminaea phylloscopi]
MKHAVTFAGQNGSSASFYLNADATSVSTGGCCDYWKPESLLLWLAMVYVNALAAVTECKDDVACIE